jgi:hypothetical protein
VLGEQRCSCLDDRALRFLRGNLLSRLDGPHMISIAFYVLE